MDDRNVATGKNSSSSWCPCYSWVAASWFRPFWRVVGILLDFAVFFFPGRDFMGGYDFVCGQKVSFFFRRGGLFEVLVSAFYGFFSTVLEMSRSEWHSSNHVPMGSENPPPHASDGGVAMSWVSERCFKRLRASQWGCETKKLGRNVGAKISSFPPSILSLNRLEKGYIWN